MKLRSVHDAASLLFGSFGRRRRQDEEVGARGRFVRQRQDGAHCVGVAVGQLGRQPELQRAQRAGFHADRLLAVDEAVAAAVALAAAFQARVDMRCVVGAGHGAVAAADALGGIGPDQPELVFMHGAGGAYAGAHGVVAVVARDGHVVGERVLRERPVDIGLPGAAFVVDDHAEGHVRSVVMVVLARYDAGSAPGAARIVVKEAPWHNAAFGRKRWKTKTILPRRPVDSPEPVRAAPCAGKPRPGEGGLRSKMRRGAPAAPLRVADAG